MYIYIYVCTCIFVYIYKYIYTHNYNYYNIYKYILCAFKKMACFGMMLQPDFLPQFGTHPDLATFPVSLEAALWAGHRFVVSHAWSC